MSRGEPVDLDLFTRALGHLRRVLETLGIERSPKEVGGLAQAWAEHEAILRAEEAARKAAVTSTPNSTGNSPTEET